MDKVIYSESGMSQSELATLDNDVKEPTSDQLRIAELEKQVEKLTTQHQGACIEARSAQKRAQHAESQLDCKRRMKEVDVRVTEDAEIEDLMKRNTDLLRQNEELTREFEKAKRSQDYSKAENAHLKSRLRKKNSCELSVEQLKIAELQKQVEKLTKQYQDACAETRSAQLREEHAERQLEDDNLMEEGAKWVIEKESMEELKTREMDLLRQNEMLARQVQKINSVQEYLIIENDHLRSKLREKETTKIDGNERVDLMADVSIEEEEMEESTDDYKESDEDSEEDDEPTRKKSKSEPKKKVKKRRSSSEESHSESSMNYKNINATELECPECEYRTRSVSGWEMHLNRAHSTNAKKAGVALRCGCGVECYTDWHFRMCKVADATVIKIVEKMIGGNECGDMNTDQMNEDHDITVGDTDSLNHSASIEDINGTAQPPNEQDDSMADDPIAKEGTTDNVIKKMSSTNTSSQSDSRIKEPKINATELKCPKCEYRTRSVSGWEKHLKHAHSTNARLAGVALRCACGMEFFTEKHFRTCKVADATVVKIVDKMIGENERGDSMADDPIENEGTTDNVIKSSEATEVKKGRGSSRVALQYKETDEDSEEDDEPTRKKSRWEPENKKEKIRTTSTNVSSHSENGMKEPMLNEMELKCPECEYHARTVFAFVSHLKRTHYTNARQAGVALRCACGVDCFSDQHFLSCKIGLATVIKIYDMKESVSNPNDTELECPECEYRSKSAKRWMSHLSSIHSTTPTLAGLVLRCDCGHESLSEKHTLVCKSTNVVVIRKRHGPIRRIQDEKETPQCVLCEVHPATVTGYAYHLHRHHKTNLKESGIYLKCACDFKVASRKSHKNHKECDGRDFTLHQLDENEE